MDVLPVQLILEIQVLPIIVACQIPLYGRKYEQEPVRATSWM